MRSSIPRRGHARHTCRARGELGASVQRFFKPALQLMQQWMPDPAVLKLCQCATGVWHGSLQAEATPWRVADLEEALFKAVTDPIDPQPASLQVSAVFNRPVVEAESRYTGGAQRYTHAGHRPSTNSILLVIRNVQACRAASVWTTLRNCSLIFAFAVSPSAVLAFMKLSACHHAWRAGVVI